MKQNHYSIKVEHHLVHNWAVRYQDINSCRCNGGVVGKELKAWLPRIGSSSCTPDIIWLTKAFNLICIPSFISLL
uniref:Uncharacterized protein n=1 Tax=Octopus bimaculoides TaxID=37653 RepID=A0A0L8GA44_OCTBM